MTPPPQEPTVRGPLDGIVVADYRRPPGLGEHDTQVRAWLERPR